MLPNLRGIDFATIEAVGASSRPREKCSTEPARCSVSTLRFMNVGTLGLRGVLRQEAPVNIF